MKLPISISQLQSDLIDGKYSAVDLVDAYLLRITNFDKKINSFITLVQNRAYADAKRVDKIIRLKGENALKEYPLLGVVVGHKDLFLTQGIRTTAGAKVLDSYVPSYSATVVKRLENAGTILIGKLNCDAWAHGSSGENSDYGPTHNPWSKDHVAGGSSSGSSAAVASLFCTVSTGTDTCGSIRLPANFTGIVGFKPTYGSVSRYGAVAMASSLDSMGHFAKTVNDTRKVYQVTKDIDGFDATIVSSKNNTKKDKFTVGIPKEFTGEGIDPEVVNNLEQVFKTFESLGIKFKEVSLPSTKYGISAYYIIQPAEVSSNLGRYDGIRFGKDRSFFSQEAKRRIMLGTYVLSSGYYDAYYLQAMKVRSKIIHELETVFEEVDVLIAPVSPTSAFKLGEKVDDPLTMYLSDIYAATANLGGIPGIAIPSGFTKKGLPLGFQLMGPRFCENTLFNLGELYQENTHYHTTLPDLTKI